jgi:hypothetical protein
LGSSRCCSEPKCALASNCRTIRKTSPSLPILGLCSTHRALDPTRVSRIPFAYRKDRISIIARMNVHEEKFEGGVRDRVPISSIILYPDWRSLSKMPRGSNKRSENLSRRTRPEEFPIKANNYPSKWIVFPTIDTLRLTNCTKVPTALPRRPEIQSRRGEKNKSTNMN